VKADFVRVDVVRNSGRRWSDVHMHVSPKEEVATRPVKPGGIPLDIALIMYDSTSAANFKRKMPSTLEYLTKNLNSILLEGIVLSSSVKNHSYHVKSVRFRCSFMISFLCPYKRILYTII